MASVRMSERKEMDGYDMVCDSYNEKKITLQSSQTKDSSIIDICTIIQCLNNYESFLCSYLIQIPTDNRYSNLCLDKEVI